MCVYLRKTLAETFEMVSSASTKPVICSFLLYERNKRYLDVKDGMGDDARNDGPLI